MKNLFRANVFLAFCLLLTACGQAAQITPLSSPSPTETSVPTVTPIPSQTVTATITPAPTQTYIPPTLIPTIDPTLVPGLLSKAFSVQTIEGVNGHQIRKVTSWDYGFGRNRRGGYRWLDSNHLILYPVIGQEPGMSAMADDLAPQPVVINLNTGNSWLPNTVIASSRDLRILITSEADGISTYTFDGGFIAQYSGNLLGISPSGTKILVTDDKLIDLRHNKVVDFSWEIDHEFESSPLISAIWSSDETRVYTCCYNYSDMQTGESYSFPYNEYTAEGGTHFQMHGKWVLSNSYLLVQWNYIDDTSPGYIPLFEPATKTYLNLNELTGIPALTDGRIPNCNFVFAAPGGQYVWTSCYSGDYLIDLANFGFVAFPDNSSYDYPTWSADGKFAWLDTYPRQILSGPRGELNPLPINPLSESRLWWHPIDNILAYISEDKQKLELVNAQTMSVQEIALPTAFQELVWNSPGDHIALLAEDGSLWQVDYPKLESLEQLTPPLSYVGGVNWSPDGNSIAFVSGSDIYIVETNK